MYVRGMSGTVVQEMIAAMRAAHDALAACGLDVLTRPNCWPPPTSWRP